MQLNTILNPCLSLVTSGPIAMVAGGLCAIPALEMTHRAIQDLASWPSHYALEQDGQAEKAQLELKKRKLRQEFGHHAIGALFLGFCAANLFSGSAVVGLGSFAIYGKYFWQKEAGAENQCRSIVYGGIGLTILSPFKWKIIKTIGRAIGHVAISLISGVQAIVQLFCRLIGRLVHTIKMIAKDIGKFCYCVICLPLKLITKSAKIFASIFRGIIRHPSVALVALTTTACLIVGLTIGLLNRNLIGQGFIKTAQSTKFIVNIGIHGLKAIPQVLSAIFTGINHSIGPISQGMALTGKLIWYTVKFIPEILVKIVRTTAAASRIIRLSKPNPVPVRLPVPVHLPVPVPVPSRLNSFLA